MCCNSCFKGKNCLELRKAREIGVNTPCIVLTFPTHQSRQQPETVGLKVKTRRAKKPPCYGNHVCVTDTSSVFWLQQNHPQNNTSDNKAHQFAF